MAYARMHDGCDLYLYHDGDRFNFSSPMGDHTAERAEDALGVCLLLLQENVRIDFQALHRLAREVLNDPESSPSIARALSDGSDATVSAVPPFPPGPHEAPVDDRGNPGPTALAVDDDGTLDGDTSADEARAWERLAERLRDREPVVQLPPSALPASSSVSTSMPRGPIAHHEDLAVERLEASLNENLGAIQAVLDGTGDPETLHRLVDWGDDLSALDLDLVCVARSGGLRFELSSPSRARLEQHVLRSMAMDSTPRTAGVERSRL